MKHKIIAQIFIHFCPITFSVAAVHNRRSIVLDRCRCDSCTRSRMCLVNMYYYCYTTAMSLVERWTCSTTNSSLPCTRCGRRVAGVACDERGGGRRGEGTMWLRLTLPVLITIRPVTCGCVFAACHSILHRSIMITVAGGSGGSCAGSETFSTRTSADNVLVC
jgi:hypothetical protein